MEIRTLHTGKKQSKIIYKYYRGLSGKLMRKLLKQVL